MNAKFWLAAFAIWLGCITSEASPAAHAPPGAPVPPPGRPPAAGQGVAANLEQLRVATWNLEWLHHQNGKGPVPRGPSDYARLRRYAERLDADVIALQEVDGVEAAARVFPADQYNLYVAAQSEAQRTGFAVRKPLRVVVHPDYEALAVGQLRAGTDISVELGGRTLRMLSVHLKSGCFEGALAASSKDCHKLWAQLPALEAWIDARSREGAAALVLGDFNRRLFGPAEDPLWRELDDGDPPDSDLWSPTEGQTSRCWGAKHPVFIDHIVFNRSAARRFVSGSFVQLLYDAEDAAYRRRLSDHCPLVVTLRGDQTAAPASSVHARDAGTQPARAHGLIKGNVSGSRRLFHEPGCPDYARTAIDESKGERWFSSAAEAEAAGWTKAANCP